MSLEYVHQSDCRITTLKLLIILCITWFILLHIASIPSRRGGGGGGGGGGGFDDDDDDDDSDDSEWDSLCSEEENAAKDEVEEDEEEEEESESSFSDEVNWIGFLRREKNLHVIAGWLIYRDCEFKQQTTTLIVQTT